MNSVILVADEAFGEKLEDLPPFVPIWVVDSPVNHRAIDELIGTSSVHSSITTFEPKGNETPLQMASRIAGALDQHHNELAQRPAYDTLDVFGLEAAPDLLDRFAEYGFRSMAPGNGYIRLTKNL